MDIQWQLLVTHLIGFLITLWILKKLAWGPLLNLMEQRREKIAGEFKKIEESRSEVDKLAAEYQGKLKEIDSEKRAKLVEAVNEGKKVAEEIKAAAHHEAKEIAVKSKSELARDVAKAKVQLKNDMVNITVKAAEKIIHDKLDDQKHRELIGRFIDSIEKV